MTAIESFLDRPSWLAARKGSIGSSDMADVCDAYPRGVQAWAAETGPVRAYRRLALGEEVEENARMRAGRHFESAIGQAWAELEAPHDYDPLPLTLARHPSGVRVHASPDAVCVDKDGRRALVEIKRASPFSKKSWLKDGPPLYYLVQAQTQLGVCRDAGVWPELERLYFAVDFGSDEQGGVYSFTVEPDGDLWRSMLGTAKRFLDICVDSLAEPVLSCETGRWHFMEGTGE